MEPTIGKAFAETVKRCPNSIFLTDGVTRLSFRQAHDKTGRIARMLLGAGLKRHDRLALWMPNSLEWVLVMLACARIGVLVVTVNTRNKAEETAHVLRQSKASMLVMVDRYWGIDYKALLAPGVADVDGYTGMDTTNFPHLRRIIVLDGAKPRFNIEGWQSDADITDEALAKAEALVAVSDPAITVFTSGTTGFPKGAVHSHILLKNVANIARALHIEAGDTILGHMPFYHIAGLCTALFAAMLRGCTLLTVAHWKADHVAALIARHQVNIFGGIPTHFIDLADAVERTGHDTSCLKSAWIGGATVTPEVARRAKTVTGLTSLQSVYGMTETTSSTVLSRFEDPIETACENKGVPIGDFEVAVFDAESGKACPVDKDGEIRVRGYLVMDGYLDDPEATAAVMTADGWFCTGDLGRFDSQGYLKVTGRLKDMFIVGGTNAYPAEIERCLEGLEGLRQAVVVGVPEPRLGEVGFAFVQRNPQSAISEQDVIAYARLHLADYKIPRHVLFVDEFPLTSTNKIQRHVLAAKARLHIT